MEVRTKRGHLFPVCCLTGFRDDRREEARENAAHVSAAIRVLAVKRSCCRAKGQQGIKQVTSSAPKDGRLRQILSQINLEIIIMHLYVNNSEAKIHFWINSAPGGIRYFFSAQEGEGNITSVCQQHGGERLEYMCAFILPPLVSAKLFMSSRSIQSQCVSWHGPYIS